MDKGSAQSTVPSVRLPMLQNFEVCQPPLSEQKRIADFLDAKCADIDQIRADIEKQIEILTDYKKSVITEAVTKGLDPRAKMKDSGIEWIGKIPDTWNVIRLKNASWLKGRIGWQGLRAEEFTDEGPFLITGTDFKNGYVDWNTCVHISEQRFNQDLAIQIKENDLLITKDGDMQLLFIQSAVDKMDDTCGRAAIIENGSPLFTGGTSSGESQIRRWLLEKDLIEAIIALPTDLFYNTGIATYIWVLSKNKSKKRWGTRYQFPRQKCP